jgi:hypothetical protein
MRFLLRWAIRLFVVAVVLIVALVLLRDTLIQAWVEARFRAETGLEVRIGRMDFSFFHSRLTMEDVRAYNTAAFGGGPLIILDELHLEYDPRALRSREIHLALLRLDIDELCLAESRDGRTNWIELLAGVRPAASAGGANPITDHGFRFTGIDTVNLSLEKLRFLSLRNPDRTREVPLRLRQELMTNVQSSTDVMRQMLKLAFRRGISLGEHGVSLGAEAPPASRTDRSSPGPTKASAK